MLIYAIDDVNKFNSINKAQNYSDDVFEEKLRGQLVKFIKSVVANAPADENIPVLKIERKILELSELVQRLVSPKIEQLFGVNVRSLDITEIKVDKDSPGYLELKSVTTDLERENITTQHQVNLSNFTLQNDLNQDTLKRQHEMQLGGQEELQRMQLENQRETMRIQREELQRATRLQTETNFLGAHQANLNAEVGKSRGGMFGNRGAAPQMPQMPGMPPCPVAVCRLCRAPCLRCNIWSVSTGSKWALATGTNSCNSCSRANSPSSRMYGHKAWRNGIWPAT